MAAAGMKKVAALTTLASLNVYAIAKEEAPPKPLKPTQLPIYNVPCLHSKYIEEQPGRLQTGIASVRTTACHYVGWCKGVYVWMRNGIMDTVQFGKDAYLYLKNPPQDFLPKIGVITASGLVGLISAKKGSKFKKIAYPLGLTALGASVCYPAQAIVITKDSVSRNSSRKYQGKLTIYHCDIMTGWVRVPVPVWFLDLPMVVLVTGKKAYATSQWIYEVLGSLWTEKYTQKETELKEVKLRRDIKLDTPASMTATQSKVSTLSAEVAGKLAPSSGAVTATQFKADPKLMDHGQSNPEDVDMYSTRS
ncbi:MICOS complex subunit MIC27 isoform X2 [Vombatus ursinus]|uniref:MICOS complex subunit MIC27 isoform X2 n=1 Tax=Vombatus ursinus TaxID=29139 RepID=UPI000FFD19B9|nr:MICOS complex subunit MIC27 isoform X2 [Vombatus ursinus]